MSSNEAEVQITGVCTKNDFCDFAKNAKDVLKNKLTSYSKRVRVKTCVAQPRSDNPPSLTLAVKEQTAG